MTERFAPTLGDALRRARRARGLTLADVHRLSRGRFKASAVGGYERGERMIAVDRFFELATLYGVPADRLLSEVVAGLAPEGRLKLVIDPRRLPLVDDHVGRVVAEFVHRVRALREDYLGEVITLRSGDVEALGLAAGVKPRALVGRLRPAIVRTEGHPERVGSR